MVSTSEYVIAGILDKVAASSNVSVSMAGQLITVFALANAFGSPLVIMATTKMNPRKLLMLSLSIMVFGCLMTFTLPGFGFLRNTPFFSRRECLLEVGVWLKEINCLSIY
ncbi:hypothetical protein [Bacillus sp. ISL-77]